MFLLKSRVLKNEKGASAVEFALILIPLVILIFAILEFGILFNNWIGLTFAAREGARLAAVGAYDEEKVKAIAPTVDMVIVVSPSSGGEIGSPVTVTVTGSVINFFFLRQENFSLLREDLAITLTRSATLMIEKKY